MAQATVWRITVENNRTWDGVMLPPANRNRTTFHFEANPFLPEAQVREAVTNKHVRAKMDRILKIERWKEVVL